MKRYVKLEIGGDLPEVAGLRPFKALVVIQDEDTSAQFISAASDWLVRSGC